MMLIGAWPGRRGCGLRGMMHLETVVPFDLDQTRNAHPHSAGGEGEELLADLKGVPGTIRQVRVLYD